MLVSIILLSLPFGVIPDITGFYYGDSMFRTVVITDNGDSLEVALQIDRVCDQLTLRPLRGMLDSHRGFQGLATTCTCVPVIYTIFHTIATGEIEAVITRRGVVTRAWLRRIDAPEQG